MSRQANAQRDTWFDDWLDARVAGTLSHPAPDLASLNETNQEAVQQATTAADQVHALTAQNGGFEDSAEMHAVWEKVTSQQALQAPTFVTRPVPFRLTWSAVASVAIAAALVVGIIAGFRGFDGNFFGGGGSGDGGEQIQFAAPGPSTATPVVVASDDGSFIVAATTCTTEPLTRDELLAELAAGPKYLSQRSIDIMQPDDDRNIDNAAASNLFDMANQYFACMAEGKPMSALALTNFAFKQEWISTYLAITQGSLSDAAIEALVDDLVGQQEASEAGQAEEEAPASGEYLPAFKSDSFAYVQTTDGRVHLIMNWISPEGPPKTATYLTQVPNDVTFENEETGEWQIDLIGFSNYGG
jgi:hypothetical protein